ncbi:MAG: MiaB/RimO family radical SAM methylthiotransferase, partial [Pseudomonadota bacterium]
MSKTEIITLGCRLNTYESEVMRRHADDAGLSDTVIVNTCAVTGEAVRQATQTIRRLRRDRPDARIVVTGCAAQIDPDRFANLGEVDHVIGNGEKMIAETFIGLASDGLERVVVNDIMSVRETAAHMIEAFGTRARAYVQVQNGCDHRCTFCIIPYGRGPSRSVPMGDVVREVQGLVDAGYTEVVLTGVDMTSYGGDLPGEPKLGRLVRSVLKHVPDLRRLRLSSIDQVEADDDLMRALADEERLMPHLHLSLQAGDDMILKRMKRRHSRQQAVDFCKEALLLRPDIVFGADIIAGFPT